MRNALTIAASFYEAIGTPLSLKLLSLLKEGKYLELVSTDLDPRDYSNPKDYYLDAMAVGFLKKFDGLPTGLDLKALAEREFFQSEAECYSTNERLSPFLYGIETDEQWRLSKFFGRVRKIIKFVVGNDPFDDAFELIRFGPGATLSDPAKATTVPDKLSSCPSITQDASYILPHWECTMWGRLKASSDPDIVLDVARGNEFFTVPKKSTQLRGCGKEPSINVAYQLGYGSLIRRHLKRTKIVFDRDHVPIFQTFGIDLDEGQDTHRRVAEEASITGSFATIDLSRASDTVSRNLVRLLLPEPWYDHLDGLRSKTTFIGGRTIYLEKFSSMGNGFTFDLETLIFVAIAYACLPADRCIIGRDLFVYGDDILVRAEYAQEVLSALRFCGFTPNIKKTFIAGPFRESCGGDFFDGKAVRPFFLEEEPDEPQKLISLCNGIRRLGSSDLLDPMLRRRILRVWFRVIDLIPTRIRQCRGPEELGDLVIHDEPERWGVRWRYSEYYQRSVAWVRVYRPAQFAEVHWSRFSYEAQLAAAVYFDQAQASAFKRMCMSEKFKKKLVKSNFDIDEFERYLVPRDGVTGYKVGWTSLFYARHEIGLN